VTAYITTNVSPKNSKIFPFHPGFPAFSKIIFCSYGIRNKKIPELPLLREKPGSFLISDIHPVIPQGLVVPGLITA